MTLGNRTKEEVNYFFLLVAAFIQLTRNSTQPPLNFLDNLGVRAAAVMIIVTTSIIAPFRLEYEDDYQYESKVLSMRTSKIFAVQA